MTDLDLDELEAFLMSTSERDTLIQRLRKAEANAESADKTVVLLNQINDSHLARIAQLERVREAAQDHEHTASAFGVVHLPVPGCPICVALAALEEPVKQ